MSTTASCTLYFFVGFLGKKLPTIMDGLDAVSPIGLARWRRL